MIRLEDKFGRSYFEGLGYSGLYRDFPCHYVTAQMVLERKPESVLELGGARGYICKLIQNVGVKATCMDISEHGWHTRATEDFILHDATVVPYGIVDKQYDLCFSIAFLEHIPEDKIELVIRELARVSKRGLHGITFTISSNDIDKTHLQGTIRPKEWWMDKFKLVAPDYQVEIVDKEEMEKGPVSVPSADGLVKLNLGCFMDCFHYGWENYDIQDLSEWAKQNGYLFKQVDVTKGIPKPDNSVNVILASHFLEHLDRAEGANFLKECFRVLKPNGLLRLAVPDPMLLCDAYLKHKIMDFRHVNVGVEKAPDEAEALFHLLIAGHKTIYDFDSLRTVLGEAAFIEVEQMPPFKSHSSVIEKQTVSMYPTLSCYVEGKKPEIKQEISPKAKVTSDSELKIALVSTPYFPTPPMMYGGLEMIVADLGEALAEMGHDVTVFAANGSKVQGCKIVEFGPPLMNVNIDWLQAERRTYDVFKDQLKDFDIISAHDWFGFEYLAKAKSPQLKILHTHHGGLNLDWWKRSPPPFKLNMVAISDWMVKVYSAQGFTAKRVHNGINLERYKLQRTKGNRLLFLGRISKIKAPHLAVEVAKKANMGLDVVGGTSFVDDPAYVELVKSLCDGEKIRFVGEVSHEDKLKYLQNARTLVVPSSWGEPFGLHVIEAMAVGTPVVALPDGGIAETIKEGGVLCSDLDWMVDAIKRNGFDATRCRRNAMRFSRNIMAENYLKLYREVLSGTEW